MTTMFKVGDRVISIRNAPDCASTDLSNETGTVIIVGDYKGRPATRVRLDNRGYTLWYYTCDLELLAKLPEGISRCKCGAITSNKNQLCCDCKKGQ